MKQLYNNYKNNPINSLIRAYIRYDKNLFNKKIFKYIKNENSVESKILLSSQNIFFQPHYNELYLLNSDIKEKDNLFNRKAIIAKKIFETAPLHDKFPEFFINKKNFSKEEIEILKSLGYIK